MTDQRRASIVTSDALEGIPHSGGHASLTPLELVGLSEFLYRQVFAVGMIVSAVICLMSLLLSQQHEDPRVMTAAGLLFITAGQVVVAIRSGQVYSQILRRPVLVLLPAAVVGASAALAGSENQEFFYVQIVVIGAWGISAPFRVTSGASAVAGAGLILPAIGSPGTIALGGLAVLIPLFFWGLVQYLARFMLHLGRSLSLGGPHQGSPVGIGHFSVDTPEPPQQRTLTVRAESTVDWRLGAPRWRRVFAGRESPLTARQEQAVFLLCAGFTDDEIAEILGISVAIVRRHLAAARERTGSSTRGQLAAWTVTQGLC